MVDQVDEWRMNLVEAIAEEDETLLEKYLGGEELRPEEIMAGIRSATIGMKICPVICGSAFKNKGVQALLDCVVDYLPSPVEVPAMVGVDPDTKEEILCECSDDLPLSALAFKLMADPFFGHLTFLRVYSGVLVTGSTVLNAASGKKNVSADC
jgi:translation elongation factor 2 (EF-2/EF-G)